MRPTVLWCAVATTLLLQSGCSSEPPPTAILLTQTASDGVTLLADVSGELTIVNGACFGIDNDDGTFTAIFPAGSTASGSTVTIPGLGNVELGDRIAGGGTYANLDSIEYDIPRECRTDLIPIFELAP